VTAKAFDVLQLQDEIVRRIVESLSLPLTAREHRRPSHDVPASPSAYEPEQSLAELKRVVEQGFCCVPAFVRDPWLDGLRDEPGFVAVLRQSEARHQEAVLAFAEAGGGRLLGVPARSVDQGPSEGRP
jgi:hypothetical protein